MPHQNASCRAALALGSNVGSRAEALAAAAARIAALPATKGLRLSRFYETLPVGGPPGQGLYLNAAAILETALPPGELLQALLRIELELGRDRSSGVPNAPRTIDLDLLLYDGKVLDEPGLCLPHPRMHLRRFVLEPLVEIAPDWLHPVQQRNIADLLRGLP